MFEAIKRKILQEEHNRLDNKLIDVFFNHFCEFARRIFNYRMEDEIDALLREAGSVLIIEGMRENLFKSAHECLTEGFRTLKEVAPK